MDERAVKLTTALYFTPNGRSIQAEGIEPDIEVERAQVTAYESSGRLKEADLSKSLANKNGASTSSRQSIRTETDCRTTGRCSILEI